MKKPEKKDPTTKDICNVEYACGYNQAIDDYDAWIDEAPIEEIIRFYENKWLEYNFNSTKKEFIADAIRKLLKGNNEN